MFVISVSLTFFLQEIGNLIHIFLEIKQIFKFLFYFFFIFFKFIVIYDQIPISKKIFLFF
jgi:hypothetical protein